MYTGRTSKFEAAALADLEKPSDADAIYAELMSRARRSYIPPSVRLWRLLRPEYRTKPFATAREAFEIRDPMSQFFLSMVAAGTSTARLLADPRFREMSVDMGWLLK